MKTIRELYNEIIADDELKKAFAEAAKNNKVEDFAAEHDCQATVSDIMSFLEGMKGEDELSKEELENAAGGGCVLPDIDTPNSMVNSSAICMMPDGMARP